jgi:acetolactate decarboxylase
MKIMFILILCSLLFSIASTAQVLKIKEKPTVKVSGAMRNVMWEGKLGGTVDLDTIQEKKHLYGIGPVEYLTGEILIIDGHSYTASVATDTSMMIKETFKTKAPFFVYANVSSWNEYTLKKGIKTAGQLEDFLLKSYEASGAQPFVFKIKAYVDSAIIHLVNLPKGTVVKSPDDAHMGKKQYKIKNTEVEIAGFFSTGHKGVFTHHDSFIHMHLITADKKMMGHLDSVQFADNMFRLYLP